MANPRQSSAQLSGARPGARREVAPLGIPLVLTRTLRSPSAVIGTELLAGGEIIENTRNGSPF
jgi:hypothetical protein